MQLKGMNRRQMLTGAGLLAGGSAAASVSSTAPQLAGAADTAYGTLLGKYFAGALTEAKLAAVQPVSAVLVNQSKTLGIRAVAVRWTVTTAQGVHSEVVFHMTPGYMAKDGAKTVGVARRLLVPKGRAVLLTPATVVTSGQYSRGYRPHLTKDLQRNLRRQFYRTLASTVSASAVVVSVEGLYYSDGTISGAEGSALHQHVRLVQNAEHDQALSVIRVVREAATGKTPTKLAKRRFQRLSRKGTVVKRDYQYARKQHARKMVKTLKKHGQAVMVRHLETLLKYPKINAGPETKA